MDVHLLCDSFAMRVCIEPLVVYLKLLKYYMPIISKLEEGVDF